IEDAREMFFGLSVKGLHPDVITCNIMLHGLCKGLPNEAYVLLKKGGDHGGLPDSCCYNTIIKGFFQNKDTSNALQLLDKMVVKRYEELVPNIVCYSIIIDCTCKNGRIEYAREMFLGLSAKGLHPDVITCNIMLHGLKEGLPNEAYVLLKKGGDHGGLPDSCCYNTIVKGFFRNKDTSNALQLLDKM
ncbi:LOW QUALITY PROTEIN: PPR_1 domain-containing protein/PPR_2 domain-containing protein, partial [Cephalotus follicularis]